MGSGNVKKELGIDKGWQLVKREDAFNLVRDKNGRLGQEYDTILDNRYSPSDQLDIYQHRRTTTAPIVRTFGAQHTALGSGLVPQNHLKVVTERIKHRLSDVPQLTYPESLYVLDKSMAGYSHLYDKVGAFRVNSEMIGFTEEGEAKVWLNENLGSNHIAHERNILQSTTGDKSFLKSSVGNGGRIKQDEASMVRNIADVVEEKTQEGIYPQPFRSRIQAPGLGFREAQNLIQQTITDQRHIRLNSIDFINNTIKIRGTGKRQQAHYLSHNDYNLVHDTFQRTPVVNTTYVPPTTNTYTTTYVQPATTTTTYVQPVTTTYVQPVTTTYVQPATTTYVQPTTVYTGSYQPMPSAKTSNLKFNYIKPTENFHPNMYVGGRN